MMASMLLRSSVVWLAVLLSGCALVGSGGSADSPERIRAGESFGFCSGYCNRIVDITPAEIQQFELAHVNSPNLPDRMQTRPIETVRWHRLSALIDPDIFAGLDTLYGCPDCADGGAEWVELVLDGTTRRVTFEYNRPPAALAPMADSLRAIRQGFEYD